MIRLLLVYLVAVVIAVFGTEDNVSTTMESNGVVPDVVDAAPKKLIEVSYDSGVKAELGNELTPTQVKDIPSVSWEAKDNELYTLILTDPDAPSRAEPKFREVRHWLVVNIPGNNISKGQTVFEYIGSGPPKGSGIHRYVFLVFKQKDKISTNIHVSNRSREGRLSSSTRGLIKEYDLEGPIAGNFYQAQFDDYVLILHEQLGGAPPKQ